MSSRADCTEGQGGGFLSIEIGLAKQPTTKLHKASQCQKHDDSDGHDQHRFFPLGSQWRCLLSRLGGL